MNRIRYPQVPQNKGDSETLFAVLRVNLTIVHIQEAFEVTVHNNRLSRSDQNANKLTIFTETD